jgi:hypothetical protein
MAEDCRRSRVPWISVCLFLAGATTQFWRFRYSSFLVSYDDDFFYYLLVAKNIAHSHVSTFDGTHLTNGYHPLWMSLLVAITLIAPGKATFYLLQAVIVALFMVTYWAARGIFRVYSQDPLATELGASVVAVQMLVLSQGGMEIALTIPLILTLCRYRLRPEFRWSPPTAIIYGLLASLVVLSRLDAVLFVALLFMFECVLTRLSSPSDWLVRLSALASGSIPIGIYVLLNLHFFHTSTPVSGQAKQLRTHHVPSLTPLISLLHYRTVCLLIVVPVIVAICLSLLAMIARGRRHLAKDHLAIVLSLLLFPLLQQLVASTLSDWPLWPWYAYPFVVATAGALLIGFSSHQAPHCFGSTQARRLAGMAATGAILLFSVVDMRQTTMERLKKNNCYRYAMDLEAFSRTHEGTYAMGDCAGAPAYVIQQPLVQLEGLVTDRSYLENIKQQRDLKQVLANYGVRYYLIPAPDLVDGCYRAVEPAKPGPDSPKMHAEFCMPAIASFRDGGFPLVVLDLQSTPRR